MRVRKLMASVFVTLWLLPVFNPIPVLASLPSTSPIPLVPLVDDSRGWDNAWTETIFGNGTPPFKTIVYSTPQVIRNGSQWIDYIFDASDMSGGIGSVYVKFGPSYATIYDPDRTEVRIKDERWIAEWYDESVNEWRHDSSSYNEINYVTNSSGIYFWRSSTLESNSTLEVWYILRKGSKLKYWIKLTSATKRKYRIVWKLSGIMGIKARWAMATEDIAVKKVITDTAVSRIQFLDNLNNPKSSLSWTDTFWFNETTREFKTSFQGLELDVDPSPNHVQAEIWFGNYTLSKGESAYLDPTTVTFESEALQDGDITKYGTTHPPEDETVVNTVDDGIVVGQDKEKNGVLYFYQYRGYVSFNTSDIRDYAVITDATLKLKTRSDFSDTDFVMKVWGGAQPIYGSSLDADDWGSGTTEITEWDTANYPGDHVYINLTILPDQVNKVGRTQFKLNSSREGQVPPGPSPAFEYVSFYSGDSTDNEPKLEITWLPRTNYIDGQYWYYWNSTANEKAAIVLFGGYVPPGEINAVRVCSLFYRDLFIQDPWPYYKERFVRDLHSNGFDVLSPKNDSGHVRETTYYSGDYSWTQDWVKNASMWLVEKGYQYIFLFGFSAGGVVAAYEIQKDYASIFYAAVVADAPVDYDPYGDIYNSADTASAAKVCASFIVGVNDMALDNITEQMEHYHDNTVVHKEWHLWEDGHDPFPNHCLTHPDPPETVFDAVYNWYQHRHYLTVRTRTIGGSQINHVKVWIDGKQYYSPVTVTVIPGSHTVKVNSPHYLYGGTEFTFHHWEDGSKNNPRIVHVYTSKTVTAYYEVTYFCPTLFVWNGSAYVYETLLDIHAESDITVQHRIEQPLVKDGRFYKLSLRELDNFTSHIDQVRLYAVDSEGETHLCALAKAVHNELGKVTTQLMFDDETRVDLQPTQTIDLKLTYLGEDIAYFIFEINGYNGKIP